METWQDVLCVFAVIALVLALCFGVKTICQKILKRRKRL